MRKFFYLTGIIFLGYSCNTNSYLPGFDFKLFKKTPYWELAKAVEKEDTTRIQALINVDKLEVDYAEPKFSNTLLMLAVANNKKNSVKKLLELGADPIREVKKIILMRC